MNSNLFWMVFFPFLGSLALGLINFFSKKDQFFIARIVAPFTILISFILAIVLAVPFFGEGIGEPIVFSFGHWIEAGTLVVSGSLHLDTLSAVLALIVTGVGFLIHVYSIGYMSHDLKQTKYFAYLNLFCGFMLVLITASNLPLLFVGWEGVGLASFLLIGFWYKDQEKAFAGRKAFIVNRIGDAAFIVAMALAFKTFGTLEFSAFSPLTAAPHELKYAPWALEWIAILLFIGCMGKSAQFPLYIWLPDAMAGPTPVSALIHAATMVTAGVYVLARCAHLYIQAEVASQIVTFVGLFTAFFAATVALFQRDIKKVLAFSTVSQLGFMIVAMGVGAYSVGIFHLVTHAYFKALLFLGAGSVIHALHGEQDIHEMGGLKNYLVWTTITFFVGYAAIIGFPLFSGWFSKDAILHSVAANAHPAFFVIAVLSALLTVVYMTRLVALAFLVKSKLTAEQTKKVHESPNTMLIPMMILAVLSLVGGWPMFSFFEKLSSVFPHHEHHDLAFGLSTHQLEWLVSLLVIAVGSLTMYLYLKKQKTLKEWAKATEKLSKIGEREYNVNDMAVRLGRNVVGHLSRITSFSDSRIIDRFLNGTAHVARKVSSMMSHMNSGVPQTYIVCLLVGTVMLIYFIVGVK